MHSIHTSIRSAALVVGTALALKASAATIMLSVNPAGNIQLGDTFDVDVHLSGWNPADGMVDGITLYVGFDGSLFSYVSGGGDAGGFLSEDQQLSYAVTDLSGEAAGDRFLLSFFDNSFNADNIVGSVGGADNSGRLGSFRLRADALGTGNLTPVADSGDDDLVFFDELLFNLSMPAPITWTGATVTVVPEPALGALGMLLAAGIAVALARGGRRPGRGTRS